MEATPAKPSSKPAGNSVPDGSLGEIRGSLEAMPAEQRSIPALLEAPGPQEQAEEVDVWWGSYAARTLTPSFIVCGLVTLLVLGAALHLGAWNGTALVRYSAHGLIVTIWLIQLGRWVYRVVAINYRLTTRHLYVEHGFRHPGQPGIDLAHVRQVLIERGQLERWLGVGRICILMQGGEAPIVLEGVRDPERIANEIRKQANR